MYSLFKFLTSIFLLGLLAAGCLGIAIALADPALVVIAYAVTLISLIAGAVGVIIGLLDMIWG